MSNKTQETVADIVREIRDVLEREEEGRRLGIYWGQRAHSWLDRIEAAHKQEAIDRFGEGVLAGMREAEKDAQGRPKNGNAAKMREALVSIVEVIADLRERNPTVVDCVKNAIEMCENRAKHGLSAPPRNADRFATAQEAEAYVKGRLKIRLDGKRYKIDEQEVKSMTEWLFAPAKESEAAEAARTFVEEGRVRE